MQFWAAVVCMWHEYNCFNGFDNANDANIDCFSVHLTSVVCCQCEFVIVMGNIETCIYKSDQ